jgi:hypothetical protein
MTHFSFDPASNVSVPGCKQLSQIEGIKQGTGIPKKHINQLVIFI